MSKLNSALFIDFDNIFICASYEEIGHLFIDKISSWLKELSQTRHFNVKQVYMNPISFSQYRQPFLEHGFKVIDCPPVTTLGKTATDQEIAVDATMCLITQPHIEEYFIMSADADFTPVLRNARALGKQTGISFAGKASKCYLSVADSVYKLNELIGYTQNDLHLELTHTPPLPKSVKHKLESKLVSYLATIKKPIYIGNITTNGALEDIEIPKHRWGFKNFTQLLKHLNLHPYKSDSSYLYDPAYHAIKGNYPDAQIITLTPSNKLNNTTKLVLCDTDKSNIADWLNTQITLTNKPIHVSNCIHNTPLSEFIAARKQYGFKTISLLIASLKLDELCYHSGYIFHPKKHLITGAHPNCVIINLPHDETSNSQALNEQPVTSLNDKLQKVLDRLEIPLFNNNVFTRIFSVLSKGIALSLYCPKALSNFVTEEVVKSGNTVKTKHIENIITHLQNSGHYFSDNDCTKTLTNAFLKYLREQCRALNIPLTIKEQVQVKSFFIADKL